jgi:hypothetical protein
MRISVVIIIKRLLIYETNLRQVELFADKFV